MAAQVEGVEVSGPDVPRSDEVLTPEALELVALLHRELGARRRELLGKRQERVRRLADGGNLGFLEETRSVREDDSWQVAPPAPGLVDRRVEMTGPTERKMTINALNSGAKVWLADLEDANTPAWENVVNGQLNLKDALDRSIDFTSPEGKKYELRPDEELTTIVVRPRGWHLPEKHITVDGEEASGSLTDFGLYMVNSAQKQLDKGKGPYFYLPKMESHLEARLWNDAFNLAQDHLGIPRGTIRATVLIETYPAAFEMEEILYELRDHSAGLNAGRWDYMFSVIKTFRTRGEDFLLPDRNSVTMTVPFMRAYTELLVRTCHKRGAHAMGGMAAFIPSKDPAVNEQAFAKVRADKEREANDGFDGSWVAHPGMVEICKEVFTAVLGDRPNQIDKKREDVSVTAEMLLDVKSTPGDVTEAGLRSNISVGHPVPGGVAAGQRRGRHQQPHGGRRHRGDLPVAGVAVAAQRREARRRPGGHPRAGGADRRRGDAVDRAVPRGRVRLRAVGRGAVAVRRDVAGRRVPRLPDPPGVRPDAVTHLRGTGPASTADGRHSTMSVTHGTQTTAEPAPGPVGGTVPVGPAAAAIAAVTAAARAVLPPDGIIDDHIRLRTYECDGLAHYRVTPALVVLPETAEQLAAVVRACAEHGVPFVARGSGTGLSGGALPRADGVLVVTAKMRAIREVRREDQRAVVEPGVINLDITRAATPAGYYFAPDPSSQQICSIGGNLAENSGGAHCLKYGFTANHVLGARVRDAAGRARAARRPRTRHPRLRPARCGRGLRGHAGRRHGRDRQAHPAAGGRAHAAGRVRLHRRGRRHHVGDHRRRDRAGGHRDDGRPRHRGGRGRHALRLSAGRRCRAGHRARRRRGRGRARARPGAAALPRERCLEERLAVDPAERALIWKGRKSAFAAVGRISPDYIVQDGVIPRTSLPVVLREIAGCRRRSGVRVANVFHAGDGNLHPLVLFDDAIEGAGKAAEEVSGAILDLCI